MSSVHNRLKKAMTDVKPILNSPTKSESSLSHKEFLGLMRSETQLESLQTYAENLLQEAEAEAQMQETENALSEDSDDSTRTSARGSKKANSVQRAEELKKLTNAIKQWVKADRGVKELAAHKSEISAKIKELEEIKAEYEPFINSYLVAESRDHVKISDGSMISMVTKKHSESYSLKTIPKYMEEVFHAINTKDLAFIAESIMPLNDPKNCPEIDWRKLPTVVEDYYHLLQQDPKLLANVAALYANNSRQCDSKKIIKQLSQEQASRIASKKSGKA